MGKELTQKEKWHRAMIKKHGSEEAVREFLSANGRRGGEASSGNTGKGGGFAYMQIHDPERLKEVSAKGGYNRAKKYEANSNQD